jgi:deazaflavin-dependent oxidoreductase (nitroreductase family)
MSTEWSAGFEKQRTLEISTVGRRTGIRHEVKIQFALDADGRLFIATRDRRRDWVRNVMKNPSVEVTISGVTRKMKILPLKTDLEKRHVSELYAEKYPLARFGRLFERSTDSAQYDAFELRPE